VFAGAKAEKIDFEIYCESVSRKPHLQKIIFSEKFSTQKISVITFQDVLDHHDTRRKRSETWLFQEISQFLR